MELGCESSSASPSSGSSESPVVPESVAPSPESPSSSPSAGPATESPAPLVGSSDGEAVTVELSTDDRALLLAGFTLLGIVAVALLVSMWGTDS
jgi:hypothetical protein